MKKIKRFGIGLTVALGLHFLGALMLFYVGYTFAWKKAPAVVQVEVITQKDMGEAKANKRGRVSASIAPQNADNAMEPESLVTTRKKPQKEKLISHSSVLSKQVPPRLSSDSTEVSGIKEEGNNAGEYGSAKNKTDEGSSQGEVTQSDQSRGPFGRGQGHYDNAAVTKGIQGSVTIKALLGADGRIQSAAVVTSSGYAQIDSMGLRDIYKGSYSPRYGADGRPTACYVTRIFTYRLR